MKTIIISAIYSMATIALFITFIDSFRPERNMDFPSLYAECQHSYTKNLNEFDNAKLITEIDNICTRYANTSIYSSENGHLSNI